MTLLLQLEYARVGGLHCYYVKTLSKITVSPYIPMRWTQAGELKGSVIVV